ncbi:short-chain dehydrogenase/reductase [Sphingomonas oleivorans]|uniref:Short-chain dehydrogenase/reductase n=1 Tax=Sphingomonas oleivorans TaxID=1735121 RepID=A0A2T5FZ05_9SPHN|nr:oxidoreductase [Sphingomonas oleivorans]PTQ11837.1 short-chain dehydrogenase/reductase [Sphingomonas oleivorans]
MTNWLITGVSGGLGRALASAALDRGDRVVGTTRREADRLAFEALAPGRATGLFLDLAEPGAAAHTVVVAQDALGTIDRLVNNAGYGLVGAIEETDLDQARALFEVNLFGPIAMIQAVLPAMRARRAGHIVNITSMSGFAPWAGTAIYGASKYAMECIGQTLAQEVAPLGIRVTNVAPGGFRTGFAGPALAEAARTIPDYDDGARNSKRILAASRGQERGDPARAAAAILDALDAPEPPVHLFLGEDALRHSREHFDLVMAEMDRWSALSLSTAFPD